MESMRDSYDDQLRAARYRAERDQAREELDRAGRRIRGLESALQEARCTRAEDREAGEWVARARRARRHRGHLGQRRADGKRRHKRALVRRKAG